VGQPDLISGINIHKSEARIVAIEDAAASDADVQSAPVVSKRSHEVWLTEIPCAGRKRAKDHRQERKAPSQQRRHCSDTLEGSGQVCPMSYEIYSTLIWVNEKLILYHPSGLATARGEYVLWLSIAR
jgi:hypothetical protein